jgi:hypothetical protein
VTKGNPKTARQTKPAQRQRAQAARVGHEGQDKTNGPHSEGRRLSSREVAALYAGVPRLGEAEERELTAGFDREVLRGRLSPLVTRCLAYQALRRVAILEGRQKAQLQKNRANGSKGRKAAELRNVKEIKKLWPLCPYFQERRKSKWVATQAGISDRTVRRHAKDLDTSEPGWRKK